MITRIRIFPNHENEKDIKVRICTDLFNKTALTARWMLESFLLDHY